MRSTYISFMVLAFWATASSAAEVTHDVNLSVNDDLSSNTEIYSWRRPINEVAPNTPFVGFFIERSQAGKPIKPTIVVSVKTEKGLRPDCFKPQWYIDGQVIPQEGHSYVQAKLPVKGVLENLESVFTLQALRQVSSAAEVTYKLCESTYTVTTDEANGLARVLGLYDGKLYIPDHPPHY